MSRHPDDFHVLKRRVRLTGTLTTRTGLRIGAGSGSLADAVDLPVLRDVDGYPFIPGASLKGVVRSTLEALLRGLHDGDPTLRRRGLWSCDPFDKLEGCGHHEKGRRAQVDTLRHCAICRLFGSPIVASHVRISDAHCLDRVGNPPIELRDGVSIDRDLGTVHGGQKYDFQVVSPGVRFGLEVFADNVEPEQLGLLMAGFDQIAEGFAGIGGFTSRGLGRVDIAWTEVRRFEPRLLLGGADAIRDAARADAMTDTIRDDWQRALTRWAAGEEEAG